MMTSPGFFFKESSNQISEVVFDSMISYLPFPQKSTLFELASISRSIYTLYLSIYVSDEYFFICVHFGNSCDSNQNLSVARIFCRFWSCANCESHFTKHPYERSSSYFSELFFPNLKGTQLLTGLINWFTRSEVVIVYCQN